VHTTPQNVAAKVGGQVHKEEEYIIKDLEDTSVYKRLGLGFQRGRRHTLFLAVGFRGKFQKLD
jgi:hypothetical protein